MSSIFYINLGISLGRNEDEKNENTTVEQLCYVDWRILVPHIHQFHIRYDRCVGQVDSAADEGQILFSEQFSVAVTVSLRLLFWEAL